MRALAPGEIGVPAAGLTPTSVQVWRIKLDAARAERARLATTLSTAERSRARSIRFATHRERFTVAHGAVRRILATYVERDPAALEFTLERGGKPLLQLEPGEIDLRFNLSHSDGLALLAVAVGREVGVDIERVDERTEVMKLARRFFAPEEVTALEALPPSARFEGFFRYWTLKEAYIKALGAGLSVALDSFAISPQSQEPVRFLRSDRGDSANWTLHTLEPAERYAAAVVTEGAENSVTGYDFPQPSE